MNGVVLDSPRANAVLYFAYKEGLISEDPLMTDGFLASIVKKIESANSNYVQGLKQAAFEQLVLCQTVYVPFHIPEGVYGCVLEDGIIKSPDKQLCNTTNFEFQSINLGILSSMLKSQGISIDESEIKERLDEYGQAYDDFMSVNNGVFPDAIKASLAHIIDDYQIHKQLFELPEWKRYMQAERRLDMITNVLHDYKRVLSLSCALSAYSVFPLNGIHIKDYIICDTEKEVNLVRITCEQLDITPTRDTLSNTIKLSRTPEATAYRTKIGQWIESIRNSEYSGYDEILRDIKNAQQSLNISKKLSRVGVFCTIIGVPAIAVPQVGIPATVVGALSLVGSKLFYFANKWAAFGRS